MGVLFPSVVYFCNTMLFAFVLFMVTSTFGQSEKTCAEMGWSDEVKTGGLGVEGVCGTKGEESVCGGEIAYGDAEDICTGMGARLCTQEEYEALEAFDSGCKIEKKGYPVWTSTDCTESGGEKRKGSMTTVLSKSGEATSECTTRGDKAYGGRCCADVGEDAIDEIMAELMCIAASGSKDECKGALPKAVGRCKWNKNDQLEDRCQLKTFFGSCENLNQKNCKKAVEVGECEFVDEDEKRCKKPSD